MKKTIYLLVFLFSLTAFSQQMTIEITNIKSGKVKVFEENQRVKIRTLNGKKHIGNLKFSDSLSFTVNNHSIKIDSLQSIKKQPKTMATIKTVVLITGLATVGASLIAASDGNDAAFLLFTIGSGVTISAGLLEGINANNSNNRWRFKIMEKENRKTGE
jgi:small nuclear ribonucleoprotein (snRNP)-like protein